MSALFSPCLPPEASVAVAGVSVIVATGNAEMDTVTIDVPETLPLVAVTVNDPAVDPAVSRPLSSIEPPPAEMVHVGVIDTTLPSASFPTAVNGCVAPAATVGLAGVTVIVARVCGAVELSLPQAASVASIAAPAIATMRLREARGARGARDE